MVIAMASGLGLGWLSAPDQAFFTFGTLGTLIYVFVYVMGNIGVMRLFLGRARHEFNPVVHIVFPVVSTVALLLVLYLSLVPLPDPPISYAPWMAAFLLAAGLLLLWRLRRQPCEEWRTLCGSIIVDEPPARLTSHEPPPQGV